MALIVGAGMGAAVALVLAVAPVAWFEDLLRLSGDDAAAFLLRRYAASATAAILVYAAGALRGSDRRKVALLALGTWFAIQGAVAIVGIVTGIVGGMAWAAMFADPLIAAWFFTVSARVVTS
jgi:hypothetical protein